MAREFIKKIWDSAKGINPLVLNITNYVTVNDCANATLAVGGSPIMADDINEVQEVTKMSNALVLNIGTINERKFKSMLLAAKLANEFNLPIVLDPVGVGVTQFRNNAIDEILRNSNVSIIRGNMSEISFLYGLKSNAKGVDSGDSSAYDPILIAKAVAQKYNCVCGITGKVDIVSDGKRVAKISNGVALLSKVTGTGCMISAITGVFAGLKYDDFYACISAICAMGIAGEVAISREKLGYFRVGIIDTLSELDSHIDKLNLTIE